VTNIKNPGSEIFPLKTIDTLILLPPVLNLDIEESQPTRVQLQNTAQPLLCEMIVPAQVVTLGSIPNSLTEAGTNEQFLNSQQHSSQTSSIKPIVCSSCGGQGHMRRTSKVCCNYIPRLPSSKKRNTTANTTTHL